MTVDPETTRTVRSWLEEGRTRLPDHVLDAVLDQLPATPQRRSPWVVRRFHRMQPMTRMAVAAAAVIVTVVTSAVFVSATPADVAAPTASPIASPSVPPSPSAAAPASPAGTFNPGGYGVVGPGRLEVSEAFPVRISFRLPGRFRTFADDEFIASYYERHFDQPDGSGFGFFIVTEVWRNPCTATEGIVEPLGGSVDDLVALLATLPGYDVTGPLDVEVDGYRGKRLELTMNETCRSAVEWEAGWLQRVTTPGEQDELIVLDVDGTRVVIDVLTFPGTPAVDRVKLAQIIDSIEIEARG